MREISYVTEKLTAYITNKEQKLMKDLLGVCNSIISAIERADLFFLAAAGGTGKTFIINILLAKLCQMKHIALSVTSNWIAATLCWPHSSFVLQTTFGPVQKKKATWNSHCSSIKEKILSDFKLITWHEVTMSHKDSFEVLVMALKVQGRCSWEVQKSCLRETLDQWFPADLGPCPTLAFLKFWCPAPV